MPAIRKHPPGTYWRGKTLWAKIKVAGRLYRQTLDTNDPRIAAERVARIRDSLTARIKHGEQNHTIHEAIAAWAPYTADRVGAKTLARYLISLKNIAPYIDGRLLSEINGPLIADIIATRRATGVKIATVKRDLGALSSVMNYAIDEGWIEENPVLPRLGRLKERRDPITLPDHAHIEIVAQRAPGRLRNMILAAWLTGCRQDELASARANQFDPSRSQLTIVGKGRRRRTVDLTSEAAKALRPPKGHTWLFQARDGGPFRYVNTRWRKLVLGIEGVRAGPNNDGVVRFRFHDLRHRFAVDYLKSGRGTIYDLQMVLGHSSVRTTEIYLDHLTPAERHRAMFGGTKRDTDSALNGE